jgi:hypothetical protein
MKHLTAKPDVSMLAEPYRSVVALALEKDPSKRFESVGAMLAALPQPSQAAPGSGRLPPQGHAADNRAGRTPAGDEPVDENVVQAEAVDDEPILRAVRRNLYQARAAWDRADFPAPVKIIILLAVLFALLLNATPLIPLLILLAIFYGGYRLIRALVLSQNSSPAPPVYRHPPQQQGAQPQAVSPGNTAETSAHAPQRRHKLRRHERAAAALLMKSPRERFTELLGSMLGAVLVSIAMCMVMVLLTGLFQVTTNGPEQFAWLLLVSIAGSWAVLILSKFWEGTRGEAVLRRFAMMVVGLGLGVVAFGVAGGLLAGLPHGSGFIDSPNYRMPSSFYDAGRPLALAYMAVFGTLFLLVRWWRQADPLRRSRLSLWSAAVSAAVALFVAVVWHFPQAWLVMTAASMSVSIQLSSPWIPLHKRKHIR